MFTYIYIYIERERERYDSCHRRLGAVVRPGRGGGVTGFQMGSGQTIFLQKSHKFQQIDHSCLYNLSVLSSSA